MKPTTYILIAAVGFVFGVAASIAARRCSLWARFAFLLFGVLGLVYGALGYFLEHYRSSLDYSSRAYLDHYRTLVGGIAIGVFVVVLISGQMKLAMKPRQEV
jgi:heme/copper-type cytochrome/quinol oxidase subunit 2